MNLLDLTEQQQKFLNDHPDVRQQFRATSQRHSLETAIAYLRSRMGETPEPPTESKQFRPKTQPLRQQHRPVSARVERVRDAILSLQLQGEPFTVAKVFRVAGIHPNYRQTEPELEEMAIAAVEEFEARLDPPVRLETPEEVRCLQAIRELEAMGEPFFQIDVTRRAGLSKGYLKNNPKMRQVALDAIAKMPGKPRVCLAIRDSARHKCLKAIEHLEEQGIPFSYNQVARLAGLSVAYFQHNAELKKRVDEALENIKARNGIFVDLRNGSQLRCCKAIAELEAEGKPFTKYRICKRAGLSSSYLSNNPRMDRLAEAAIDRVLTRCHRQSWEVS